MIPHDPHRRRIGGHLAELAEPGEVRERRPAAEQIAVHADMRLERRQNPAVAFFQQRLVFGGRAENGHARNLPLSKFLDPLRAAGLGFRRRPFFRRPARDIGLILRIPPAIHEQRLDRPLVGEVFQEIADKGDGLVIGNDGTALMPCLKIIRQRRGFAAKAAVWILQHRDQHRAQMRGRRAQRLGHDHPVERYSAIAHQRAQLDRVRRCGRSDQPIAPFSHASHPFNAIAPLLSPGRPKTATAMLPRHLFPAARPDSFATTQTRDQHQVAAASPAPSPAQDYDAIVIGAGLSGMYQLYRLRELGMRVRVLEAGTNVGGTWYWNRYPGARFDSESYSYGYSFSRELLEEWNWSEHFAPQPETLRYLNFVADKFDLRSDIRFHSRVTQAHYQEETGHWDLTVEDGSRYRARFLITAIGPLSAPTMPRIEGVETFQGEAFHTARWPHQPVSFVAKRVAVVGTGATGVQTIQEVAKTAGHLTVFQRTPNWCAPLHNSKIDANEMAQIRAGYPEMFQR